MVIHKKESGDMKRLIPILFMLIVLAIPLQASADSIVMIINDNSEVDALTIGEVSRIYRGLVTKWPSGSSIVVVNRDARSEVREDFYGKVLKSSPTEKFYLPGSPIPFRTIVQKSVTAVLKFVAGEERAIAYVHESELTGQEAGIKVIKLQ
jgi:ABC-type phosphate transport system substrate-binding protein